jgi:hypothetical protein
MDVLQLDTTDLRNLGDRMRLRRPQVFVQLLLTDSDDSSTPPDPATTHLAV